MNGVAIGAIIWLPAAAIAAAIAGRRLRKPRRHWDWPETEHPSPYGWAGREKL